MSLHSSKNGMIMLHITFYHAWSIIVTVSRTFAEQKRCFEPVVDNALARWREADVKYQCPTDKRLRRSLRRFDALQIIRCFNLAVADLM